ncbi:hypothetical protein [Hyphomonas sp.]|uniref:hypothetical protein n=1 Tax=Hyphomonas sp. TaxID=87 RepID=UPI00329759F8
MATLTVASAEHDGKPVVKREGAQLSVSQAPFPRCLKGDVAAVSLRDAGNNGSKQQGRRGRAWSQYAWLLRAWFGGVRRDHDKSR